MKGFYCNPALENPSRLLSSIAPVAEKSANVPPVEPAAGEIDKLYSRLEIEVRGIDPAVLKSYAWFATTAANHLGIEVGKW